MGERGEGERGREREREETYAEPLFPYVVPLGADGAGVPLEEPHLDELLHAVGGQPALPEEGSLVLDPPGVGPTLRAQSRRASQRRWRGASSGSGSSASVGWRGGVLLLRVVVVVAAVVVSRTSRACG